MIKSTPNQQNFFAKLGNDSLSRQIFSPGVVGSGLWILSMLGPAFSLQFSFHLGTLAYDSQVALFLILFVATMYSLTVPRFIMQAILGILFFILYLWLLSTLNLPPAGHITMFAGSLLIGLADVLRYPRPGTQLKPILGWPRKLIIAFILSSIATAACTLLPISILGNAYDIPSSFSVAWFSLAISIFGTLFVVAELYEVRQEVCRIRTMTTSEVSISIPSSKVIYGFGLIIVGMFLMLFVALLRTYFPVDAVMDSPSGPRLLSTYRSSNLLSDPNQSYYAGAMLALLGLTIVLFVARKIQGALATSVTMLALTFFKLWMLSAQAEKIKSNSLVTDYSIVWESWLAFVLGIWLMILSCLLAIFHFRRESLRNLGVTEE